MTKTILASAGLLTLAAGLFACNVHDNTVNVPNASLDVTTNADVDDVTPAQSIPLTVNVHNVYLVDPAQTPPPEHVEDAGHLEFHLDDESTQALLVTAQTSVSVPIPAATPPGPHKIICRVHKHDGTPTSTSFEVAITVKVTVATTGAGGGGGAAESGGGAGADGGMATTDVVDDGHGRRGRRRDRDAVAIVSDAGGACAPRRSRRRRRGPRAIPSAAWSRSRSRDR